MDVASGADASSRLARTVHCSRPREIPPKPSITPLLWYLPSPKSIWRVPSMRASDPQIFSVHARSDSETRAKVSAIWWCRLSSMPYSGPMSLVVMCSPGVSDFDVETKVRHGPLGDAIGYRGDEGAADGLVRRATRR